MRRVAVIPAAGRGSRLGLDVPKLLVPLDHDQTPWTLLRSRLLPLVDEIRVVLSPEGAERFSEAIASDPEGPRVSWNVQPVPLGMGDAIRSAFDVLRDADVLLVVWGDQVAVSGGTLGAALGRHNGAARRVVIPIVRIADPYVEYRFDGAGSLSEVLQRREGDVTEPGGFGDVGTFVLSPDGLEAAWTSYVASSSPGANTSELNFLPFLVELSRLGWDVQPLEIDDAAEARGLNDRDDLEWIRARLNSAALEPESTRGAL